MAFWDGIKSFGAKLKEGWNSPKKAAERFSTIVFAPLTAAVGFVFGYIGAVKESFESRKAGLILLTVFGFGFVYGAYTAGSTFASGLTDGWSGVKKGIVTTGYHFGKTPEMLASEKEVEKQNEQRSRMAIKSYDAERRRVEAAKKQASEAAQKRKEEEITQDIAMVSNKKFDYEDNTRKDLVGAALKERAPFKDIGQGTQKQLQITDKKPLDVIATAMDQNNSVKNLNWTAKIPGSYTPQLIEEFLSDANTKKISITSIMYKGLEIKLGEDNALPQEWRSRASSTSTPAASAALAASRDQTRPDVGTPPPSDEGPPTKNRQGYS